MSQPSRVAELHGYLVCLVAVITVLVTTRRLVDGAFLPTNPLESEREWGGASLASFEACGATCEPREPAPPVRDGATTAGGSAA